MKTFTFRGEVVEKGTKLPAAGVRVELLDLQQRVDEPLFVTIADPQGEFTFSVDEARIERAFGNGEAMAYFRILRTSDNVVVGTTERTRRWDLRSNSSGRIEVDTTRPIAQLASPLHSVEGIVVDSAGPVAGATVTVARREYRTNDIMLDVQDYGEIATSNITKFR